MQTCVFNFWEACCYGNGHAALSFLHTKNCNFSKNWGKFSFVVSTMVYRNRSSFVLSPVLRGILKAAGSQTEEKLLRGFLQNWMQLGPSIMSK